MDIREAMLDAEEQQVKWERAAYCEATLTENNMTQEEALRLASYYEGQVDAYVGLVRAEMKASEGAA